MLNNAFDAQEIRFPIPYSERKNRLSSQTFIVDGSANFICDQDKLRRRNGFLKSATNSHLPDNLRGDRLWYLQSTEATPSEFILASCYNTSTQLWVMYAYSIASSSWASLGSSFSLAASTAPHNCCISRGRAYIKSYPAASATDKYGACMVKATAGALSVTPWGYNGPDKAISVGTSSGFTASANSVTVTMGWTYSYCYVYGTDPNYIYSNRAPIQTNPTLKSSDTGPFVNAIPRLLVRGDGARGAANSQTPIALFRTTDGGGTLYQVPGGSANVSASGGVTLTNGSANVVWIYGNKFEHVSGLWSTGSVLIDFYLGGVYHSTYTISATTSPTALTLTTTFSGTSANYTYKVVAGSSAYTFTMPQYGAQGVATMLNGDATMSHFSGDTFEHGTGLWTNNLVEVDFYSGSTYHSTYVVLSTTSTTSLELVVPFTGSSANYNYKVRDFIIEDRYRKSGNTGATFSDPIADKDLDTFAVSPTLTSHSPPPTCLADEGEIIGTNTPRLSTPIRSFAGRLWFALGNVLFCSSNEEIALGMPEHAFSTGLLGNFWRFPSNVSNIQDTTEALYIFTGTETYWLRGKTQETFQLDKLFADVGAANQHPMAITVADKTVIWLTADYRICMARGSNRDFISDEMEHIFSYFFTTPTYGINFVRYAEREKDWLLVAISAAGKNADPNISYTYIFDFNQGESGMWQPPMAGARLQTLLHVKSWNEASMKLYGMAYGISSGNVPKSALVNQDSQIFYDFNPANASNVQTTSTAIFNPFRNPAGGHLNSLRIPVTVSDLMGIKLDYEDHEDTSIIPSYSLDSLGPTTSWTNMTLEDPPRRIASTGYKSKWTQINQSAEYVSVRLIVSGAEFNLLCLGILWTPNSGV